MRKGIALVLAVLLMLSCALGAAEGDTVVYLSDFSEGADGWYARSMGSASVDVQDGCLLIVGRQSNWNSPGRDFDLVPGARYLLSVQVRQEQTDSADFMISVAHTAGGVESYENLARGTAARNEWVTLTGAYTAGTYDRFVLYVETTNAPELDFAMRDFKVEAPDGIPGAVEEEEPLPSLKEIYADSFDFGACVNRMQATNAATMEFCLSQFSILTPENELKPDAVLDVAASRRLAAEDETAVAVHFDAARPLLNFARDNGVKIHGHVLVWHGQTPEAFFHEGYDPARPLVSREVMLARMENYIHAVFSGLEENYPGVVVSWDVVNEAIDDGTNRLRNSNWMKTVGDDFVARAFEYARKYAPEGTLLYYNDYNTAMTGKLNGIVKLLESLIPEGNIDGYGFQMHHSLSFPSLAQISAAVDRVAALGLRLRISEMDIGVPDTSENSLAKQAQMYAAIMRMALAHSDQFEAVQVWGITDSQSWRAGDYPLLFDAARRPKPAFWAVANPDSVQ